MLAIVLNVTALLEPRLAAQPHTHHVLYIGRTSLVDLQEFHDLLDIAVDKQHIALVLVIVGKQLACLRDFDDATTAGKDIPSGPVFHRLLEQSQLCITESLPATLLDDVRDSEAFVLLQLGIEVDKGPVKALGNPVAGSGLAGTAHTDNVDGSASTLLTTRGSQLFLL